MQIMLFWGLYTVTHLWNKLTARRNGFLCPIVLHYIPRYYHVFILQWKIEAMAKQMFLKEICCGSTPWCFCDCGFVESWCSCCCLQSLLRNCCICSLPRSWLCTQVCGSLVLFLREKLLLVILNSREINEHWPRALLLAVSGDGALCITRISWFRGST